MADCDDLRLPRIEQHMTPVLKTALESTESGRLTYEEVGNLLRKGKDLDGLRARAAERRDVVVAPFDASWRSIVSTIQERPECRTRFLKDGIAADKYGFFLSAPAIHMLYYEVMTFCDALAERPSSDFDRKMRVECFLTHARNLNEFFRPPKAGRFEDTDIRQRNLKADSQIEPPLDKPLHDRISQWLSHMTLYRTKPNVGWKEANDIRSKVAEAVGGFLRGLDSEWFSGSETLRDFELYLDRQIDPYWLGSTASLESVARVNRCVVLATTTTTDIRTYPIPSLTVRRPGVQMRGNQPFRQDLHIGSSGYRLMVGIDVTLPHWTAVALKNGKEVKRIHERPDQTPEDLKQAIHDWAYKDAGEPEHKCNDACGEWQPS